jgi:hypothetical protein
VSDPVTYTAVLPIEESTIAYVARLLAVHRRRCRTRAGRRALDCDRQAVLLLRWFLDGTRVAQLAVDNQISSATAYRYLHEGIDVLAAAAPGLHGALLAAGAAGHTHVQLDGTLIRIDRSKAAGPTTVADRTVDLWWSGKHHHGGNVQVVTARRLAAVGLAGAPGPGTRRHLRSYPSRAARRARRVDRRRARRAGRPGLSRRG